MRDLVATDAAKGPASSRQTVSELAALIRASSDGAGAPEPDTDAFRAIGELALEMHSGTSFADLFPELAAARARIDDNAVVSTRLSNVLRRWHGFEWGGYLPATPRDFISRNNCGIRSLGEILYLAATSRPSSTVAAPIPEEARDGGPDHPAPSAPPELERGHATRATVRGSEADEVVTALRNVLAWATWERGCVTMREALDLVDREDQLPRQVAEAAAALADTDLRIWSLAMSAPFDINAEIASMYESLPEGMRLVADRRLLALASPATLEEVARGYGTSRERIRQLEVELEKSLKERLAGSSHAAGRAAARLRRHLGSASQVDSATATDSPLEELGLKVSDPAALVLLWLAGPYEVRGDWLILRPARLAIDETKQILRMATANGPAPMSVVEAALEVYGVPRGQIREWIVSVSSFRIEDDLILAWGGSMADKAVAILAIEKKPMTAEELHSRIGPSASLRGLTNQLSAEHRIKRTGVRHFGLRDWDHDEYTGVADEIEQEIGRQGGAATLDHLVSYVSETYGVAPASIRTYAAGPRFQRNEQGLVTVASTLAPRSRTREPHEARNVVRHGSRWAWRQRVNADLLRGSGFPISTALADVVGLAPMETRVLQLADGQLQLSWLSNQPTCGSVRTSLTQVQAADGDLCFIAIDAGGAALSYVRRGDIEAEQGLDRLALELGLAKEAGLEGVAWALGLEETASTASVSRRLLARGEADLAALLSADDGSDSLELTLDSKRFVEVRWSK